MKKITLLFLFVLTAYGLSAQETISFESSEGYSLGDVNGQNGWETTGTGPGTFIENQVISDEQSSDGSFSLKIVQEVAFPGQSAPIVGGFYEYSTAVPYSNAVFSADMYIDTFNPNTSDFIFGLVNITNEVFISYIRFSFEGDIIVLVEDSTGTIILDDTMQDWTPLTWFNVRMELTNNNIEFFIDDVSIYSGTVASPNLDIEQVNFAHDNFEGFAYIDNFRTNDEPLSTFDFSTANFDYYVDNNNYLNLSANEQIDNVSLHNLLGQQVLSQKLSAQDEQINLSALSSGVYLAKVQIKGATKTFKIMKK